MVIHIWDDLHNERAGFFRAFWTDDRDSNIGTPVVGYCDPGGSHRAIRAAAAEARRLFPRVAVFRNGREIRS
jgi:hypothetical protein